MIIVDGAAEIHLADREIVVEDAVRARGPSTMRNGIIL